jgi:membrane protease YdiL (CAAX protease family)
MISVILFYLGYYLTQREIMKVSAVNDPNGERSIFVRFIAQKMAGAFFLGILPLLFAFIFFPEILQRIGWNLSLSPVRWFIIIGLIFIIIVFNFYAGRQPAAYNKYPQLRYHVWSWLRFLANVTGWVIYLVSYEFLFRGILFSGCLETMELWPALILNVIIYAAVHLPQGKMETVGSIFFGTLLCLLTWHTGSVLPAIVLHATLTISMDLFAILHNPAMRFSTSTSIIQP